MVMMMWDEMVSEDYVGRNGDDDVKRNGGDDIDGKNNNIGWNGTEW